jgi:hypothetical protein
LIAKTYRSGLRQTRLLLLLLQPRYSFFKFGDGLGDVLPP